MSDLYVQVLAATSLPRAGERYSVASLAGLVAALRGVVERHKPEPCVYFSCQSPGTHVTCSACGGAVNHPCDEIKDIAEKLGITDPTARA